MTSKIRKISPSELEAFPVHPFAELFPLALEEEIDAIARDIAERGFRKDRPIIIHEGQILDGRNRREAACHAAKVLKDTGIAIYAKDWNGESSTPLDFVISENLHRRHLTESQRALVAANLANWENGLNQHTDGTANLRTQKQVSQSLSISERALQMAKKIRERGGDLEKQVASGNLSVNTAEALVELGDRELARTLSQERKTIIARAKEIRTENQRASRKLKADAINKIASKGSGQMQAMPVAEFPIIVADPPWENEVWGEETGHEKSPSYPTMKIEEIKALCAGTNSPALPDALLFLWTTGNRIGLGVDVVRAWGFEQVSARFWDKQLMGTGRWTRDDVEVLLIAKRGKIHAPDPSDLERALYSEKRGEHSAKPAHFTDVIDRQYPTLPKLELFQRKQSLKKGDKRLHRRKAGRWSFWGFEAGEKDG